MRKMNGLWGKSLLGAIVLFSLTGSAVSYAAYWSVSQEYVSEKGKWSEYGAANYKQSNSNYASFNGDSLPNSFGYNVWLINGAAARRSNTVGLYKDQTTRAGNNSGLSGYAYYADVRSKSYEPNGSTVKLHFSADYK